MNAIDFSLLVVPFLAGLLVLSTHVPLGREVLGRGIIFIDLAIAQVAGLGVILAQFWQGEEAAVGSSLTQLTAAGAACAGALLLTWTGRRWPEIQEALIGLLFVFTACAGILLLAHDPHGGEHLTDLLAGQILWVGGSQLILPALIYGALLVLWFLARQRLGDAGFYLIFALAVTFSVQLVGVFLVFASLIAPALASRHRPGWDGLALAYGIGALGYGLGLAASALWDLPAGAATAALLCLLALTGLRGRKTIPG
ncbi:metal ABC transporter permease [Denitratisoma oestradiolicum]|uniref:Zinc/manganese transporter permease n=1 Tax=Denitratisoma oestradiolicum TaxID=311182 RepID=A0A6S6Y2R4_9PROT|nr:metal ABC transporter permease [Denitratisoma oestradiolicum]TWO79873.1 zinc/manganese transporter permease [Denitratisoma oestradiolicum]CAB1369623.1 Zinc/manganese transporter permease [Denitratisoma oestradiolicum]